MYTNDFYYSLTFQKYMTDIVLYYNIDFLVQNVPMYLCAGHCVNKSGVLINTLLEIL